MGHVVHYRNTSGASHLEDVPSMDAAVELIERLRNEEGVEDVRLFREVPLKVRTYYKVVVDEASEAEDAAPTPVPPARSESAEPPPGAMNLAPPPAVAAAAPAPEPVEDVEVDEPKRASLFNRS